MELTTQIGILLRVLPPHGCSMWKGINATIYPIEQNSSYRLGSGWGIRFWIDSWCTHKALRYLYPQTYNRSAVKEEVVAHFYRGQGENTESNAHQRRPPYDWETREIEELAQTLGKQKPQMDCDDERTREGGKGQFRVRDVYEIWEKARAEKHPVKCKNFLSKKVCIRGIPSEISFFIWALIQGGTLTTDNLRKRRKIIVNRCALCRNQEESI